MGSADNTAQKDSKPDPYLVIEFPVILRLLYICGLRTGETVKISMNDVYLDGSILRLINKKGNKQRSVDLSLPMVFAMAAFVEPLVIPVRIMRRSSRVRCEKELLFVM